MSLGWESLKKQKDERCGASNSSTELIRIIHTNAFINYASKVNRYPVIISPLAMKTDG